MYPLFETIRYVNGKIENLTYHQARVNHTLLALGGSNKLQLDKIKIENNFEKNIIYKLKCYYDLNGSYSIEKTIYQKKIINSISIYKADSEEYPFKYTHRHWLNDALKHAGTDEIIITQNDIIKDGNYANLVFFNGNEWHTPLYPLLLGTHRARLLDENKIIAKNIKLDDLGEYKKIKFINAMMLWEESPEIEIKNLQLTSPK
ncbi:MAG: aminotransferase class IV [Sediminibacterium sp.]